MAKKTKGGRRRVRPETLETLSLNLRAFRTAAKLSQEGLSRKAGLYRTVAGEIERQKKNPSLATIDQIAEALDEEVGELFLRKNIPPQYLKKR